MTKRLKKLAEKIFHLSWLKENCVEKNEKKFSNQSCDAMQLLYTSELQKLLFSTIIQSTCSENFGEFLGTHAWWSTIIVKLLSRPLYRSRSKEGTATVKRKRYSLRKHCSCY